MNAGVRRFAAAREPGPVAGIISLPMMHVVTGSGVVVPAMLTLLGALALSGCSTMRETQPDRSAREQLLISTAADRAAERLNLKIPDGTKLFVDAQYMEGTDSKYAVAAVRDRLLRNGAQLAEKREQADAVVEVRAGALSIDEQKMLVGIPSWDVPVPLAGGAFKIPEIALYGENERVGIAKLAATSYAVADGKLIDSSGPQFGYAHETEKTVLLFLTWRSTDVPEEKKFWEK
jgi:hypothetical protein